MKIDSLQIERLLNVRHPFPWFLHSGKHQHKSEYRIPCKEF